MAAAALRRRLRRRAELLDDDLDQALKVSFVH
jgi:hypothetical protein